jgi:hypothetical protein
MNLWGLILHHAIHVVAQSSLRQSSLCLLFEKTGTVLLLMMLCVAVTVRRFSALLRGVRLVVAHWPRVIYFDRSVQRAL